MLAVECEVAQAPNDPVGFWRNDDASAAFFDTGYDSVAVISFEALDHFAVGQQHIVAAIFNAVGRTGFGFFFGRD